MGNSRFPEVLSWPLCEIVFRISRRKVCKGSSFARPTEGRESEGHYHEWRVQTLKREYAESFSVDAIRGKDVLDFGCGSGGLAAAMIELGARSCVGIDLSAKLIEQARELYGASDRLRFVCASDSSRVDLPDKSVDAIVCFDVMEHIMDYRAILTEWKRVLRPSGKVLIHWQPWFHPYAHHCHDYIPLPWVHVFLSDRQRTEICARIVDDRDYIPPYWDRDEQGRKINRFREALRRNDEPNFLNELTMMRFERIARGAGLEIEDRRLMPFSGPWLVRTASRLMTYIPGIREFFTANALYTLRPASS